MLKPVYLPRLHGVLVDLHRQFAGGRHHQGARLVLSCAGRGGWVSRRWNRASRKAAVLPVPVWAWPATSLARRAAWAGSRPGWGYSALKPASRDALKQRFRQPQGLEFKVAQVWVHGSFDWTGLAFWRAVGLKYPKCLEPAPRAGCFPSNSQRFITKRCEQAAILCLNRARSSHFPPSTPQYHARPHALS